LTARQHRQLVVGGAVVRQTLVGAKLVDDVDAEVVKLELFGEYLDWNVQRATKTTVALTINSNY